MFVEEERKERGKKKKKKNGPVRDSNPGPLAPKARIMPLDQQATRLMRLTFPTLYNLFLSFFFFFTVGCVCAAALESIGPSLVTDTVCRWLVECGLPVKTLSQILHDPFSLQNDRN